MRNGKCVRLRIGVVLLATLSITVASSIPVLAGRGFFQRRSVRSYSSSRMVPGSWGSHGATGGGQIVYTHNQPTAYQRRTVGTYASHGAAGGSPHGQAVSAGRPTQVRYPQGRVVTVHRAPVVAKPMSNLSAVPSVTSRSSEFKSITDIPSPPSIAKRSTFPAPTSRVVPPAPKTDVLARVAYRDSEMQFATSIPGQSIARIETQRHLVMKPASEGEVEPNVLAGLSDHGIQKQDGTTELNVQRGQDATVNAADLAPKLANENTSSNESKQVALLDLEPQQSETKSLVKTERDRLTASESDTQAGDEEPTSVASLNVADEKSGVGVSSILVKRQEQAKITVSATPKRARLVLHVPASADVYLMGRKMVTRGKTRLFNVPVSTPDKDHSYRIRVQLPSGQSIESAQLIRAGQQLDLTIGHEAGRLAVSPVKVTEFK